MGYPPYGTPLFTLNLAKFRVENLVSRKELDTRKRKLGKSHFLRQELPDFHDLSDALISSGAVGFENEQEIREDVELLNRAVGERTMYVKPVFIGIDTNIAYYRVISRRFNGRFKYVISNIVVEEIDSRIHTKYTPRMLREFEHIPHHHLFREFTNGSDKSARRAKNAMNEVQHMINRLDAFIIGKSTDTRDKEVRDREIAKQYRNFSDESNTEVIMLTADKDMVFHAQAEQLSSIFFKLPHTMPREFDIDSVKIPALVYDLTLVLGMISLGPYILLGEWPGKTSEDYFREHIMVYNPDREDIMHQKICRRVTHEFQRNES